MVAEHRFIGRRARCSRAVREAERRLDAYLATLSDEEVFALAAEVVTDLTLQPIAFSPDCPPEERRRIARLCRD